MIDPHAVYLAFNAINAMQLAVRQYRCGSSIGYSERISWLRLNSLVQGIARFQNFERLGEFRDSTIRHRKPISPFRTTPSSRSLEDLTRHERDITTFMTKVLHAKATEEKRKRAIKSGRDRPTSARSVMSSQGDRTKVGKITPANASPSWAPTIKREDTSVRGGSADRSMRRTVERAQPTTGKEEKSSKEKTRVRSTRHTVEKAKHRVRTEDSSGNGIAGGRSTRSTVEKAHPTTRKEETSNQENIAGRSTRSAVEKARSTSRREDTSKKEISVGRSTLTPGSSTRSPSPDRRKIVANPHFEEVRNSILKSMENSSDKLNLKRSHIHSFKIE